MFEWVLGVVRDVVTEGHRGRCARVASNGFGKHGRAPRPITYGCGVVEWPFGPVVIPSGGPKARRRGILDLPGEGPLDQDTKDSSSARRRRAPGSE